MDLNVYKFYELVKIKNEWTTVQFFKMFFYVDNFSNYYSLQRNSIVVNIFSLPY